MLLAGDRHTTLTDELPRSRDKKYHVTIFTDVSMIRYMNEDIHCSYKPNPGDVFFFKNVNNNTTV